MKLSVIVGARPQFIKLAPLCKALEGKCDLTIIHTGQHFDENMSQLFFDEMSIPKPDHNLGIHGGTNEEQTERMLSELEKLFQEEKPDMVVVFGDTNSTLAGAKAAHSLNIPVAHIEAGLRSFDMNMPEEKNRVETDKISQLLFAPTSTAMDNLEKEGIIDGVYMIGDIMYDSLLHFQNLAAEKSKILNEIGFQPDEYYLVTIHRASNTDNKENLKNIFEAFQKVSHPVVLPLHPRTKKALQDLRLLERLEDSNIRIIPPASYLDMLMLTKNAKKVLTDSGGLQKEAYLMKKPCITIRDTTEWVETLEGGWNQLALDKADEVNVDRLVELIDGSLELGEWSEVYGSGDAARKIVTILLT